MTGETDEERTVTMSSTLFDEEGVAGLYARHRGTVDEHFCDELAAFLRPCGPRVVDIGAGTADPAQALNVRGFEVVAVEPSAAMVAEGRRRHPGLPFVLAAGEDLPLSEATFDSATLLYVLHHVEDPERVLAESRRVVRPGGRVVVVSGNAECDRHRFFAEYFPTLVPDLPDAREISIYARAAGLGVEDVHTTIHWVYPHRTIDEDYIQMVETDMFAALRALNEVEFDRGLRCLQRDRGREIPPSEATLVVLGGAA